MQVLYKMYKKIYNFLFLIYIYFLYIFYSFYNDRISEFIYFKSENQEIINTLNYIKISFLIFSIFLLSFSIIVFILPFKTGMLKNRIFLFFTIVLIIFTSTIFTKKFYNVYRTDSAAFFHYAGVLFNHKANPYKYSMSTSIKYLNMPEGIYTPTGDGKIVEQFTYPAGAFILSGLLLRAGFDDLRIPALYCILIVFIAAFFFLKDERLKLTLIISMLAIIDLSWMPILSLFESFWVVFIFFSYFYLSKKYFLSSILLGIAISIKQTPMLIIPFFIIYSFKLYGLKKCANYIFVIFLTFILINGYFIFQDFSILWNNILYPFTGNLVSAGAGLGVALQKWCGKSVITAIQFSFFIIVIIVYFIRFEYIKNYLFIFPIGFFLLGWRSLSNYYYGYFFLALIFGLLEIDENIRFLSNDKKNN